MTSPADARVVVAGAGQAGVQAAEALRDEGFLGPITLVDEDPHLPYQRPPLSKDYIAADADPSPLPLRAASFFEARRIELIRASRVENLDRRSHRVHLSDGRALAYSSLILAMGAEPRRLAVPGGDLAGVHVLRTLDDAERLRREIEDAAAVVVIGAGFVGLEFAAGARRRGLSVTVLEASHRVLGRAVSGAMSERLVRGHRATGTVVHTAVTVACLEGSRGRVRAVIDSTGTAHPADLVLVGIGACPRVDLAADAGLTTTDGIVVDEFLRTCDPAVFAIGDCARVESRDSSIRVESVQNAIEHGRQVARTIVGRPTESTAVPWFWSNQEQLRLQIAGVADPRCSAVVRGDMSDDRLSVYRFRDERLVAVESLNSPGEHLAARRVLASGLRPSETDVVAADFSLKDFAHRAVPAAGH